jgi:hypothetical protein
MLWNGVIEIDLAVYTQEHLPKEHMRYTAECLQVNGAPTVIFNADILLTLDVPIVRGLLSSIAAREQDLGVHQR